MGSLGLGAGGLDGGSAGFGRGYCLIVLLQRDFLLIHELLVAAEVVLRFNVVSFGLIALSVGCVELFLGGCDSGSSAGYISLRRRNLAVGVDRLSLIHI